MIFFIISVFPLPKEGGKYNYVSSDKDGDNIEPKVTHMDRSAL